LALASAESLLGFTEFAARYNKVYTHDEFMYRRSIYEDTLREIAEINADPTRGWTAGVNEWSDLTWAEFSARFLMAPQECSATTEKGGHKIIGTAADPVIDWRTKNVVTPVKNQGSCGSCWAFSTTGVLEGYAKIYNNELPNVSEQQLVDCSKNGQTLFGCQGGWPWAAAQWAQSKNGLCSQTAYPYTARDGACKSGCESVKSTAIKGVVQQKGEDQLLKGVDGQPVSICLDAMGGFQSYRSGIFDGPCGTQMNHAVLAVGYTADAWIVKNSWGTSWGDKGYIQMRRGKNLCGLSNVLMWGSNQ
jgi:cathepsin H